MLRRGLFLSSLAAIAVLPIAVRAQATADQFQALDPADYNASFTPRSQRGSDRVQVVIKMSAEPVALVRARSTTKTISAGAASAVVSQVEAQHRVVEPHVLASGGKVLAHFHHAFNGLKVEIDRAHLKALSSLPGVVSVMPVRTYERLNTTSVPFIGAPQVWQATPGFRGEGVKIAIIDTGIDYTHANFGGPGTVAAFTAASATSTQPADPALFGPNAPRVKGGTDLVGDGYDANKSDPAHAAVPDSNPLDCNGHGSHTAGTAAGSGVTAAGTTYTGPYNQAAYVPGAFLIGPGVAPMADIYSVRVFGCAGSTNVVTEAIDWAVQNGMDVISMSLGSDFGPADSSDGEASHNATLAGVIVVAASGNSGPAPYMTSSPGSGNGVIVAAAMDGTAGYPGATLALTPGGTVTVQDSNGAVIVGGSFPVVTLLDANQPNGISLGCNDADYVNVAGAIVVTQRGTCARILRAQLGAAHGAAAVVMINNAAAYPVFEGPISGANIPFFGALPTDALALKAATSAVMASAGVIANPGFKTVASFSSGGPRIGDSYFKPSVAAPGVSVFSTFSGTGFNGLFESGTSMATPHIAGVAALVKQAHKTWSQRDQRAAILQSADPSQINSYDPRLAGAGVVQAVGATQTQAIVATDDRNADALSFGFGELLRDYHVRRELEIRNRGTKSITFTVSVTQTHGGPGVAVTPNRTSILVGPHSDSNFALQLDVPAAAVVATHNSSGAAVFQDISGYVTLTPGAGQNNGVSLHLPYYFVPRVRSNLFSFADGKIGPSHPTSKLFVTNFLAALPGSPDFYSLGLTTPAAQGVAFADTRAVGVRSIPVSAGADRLLVFAINTWGRFSNAAPNEFDVLIDTTGGNTPNFAVIGLNISRVISSQASGRMAAAIINLATGAIVQVRLADVATDNSTILLPALASKMGITAASPRFSYFEQHFSEEGTSGAMPGSAKFNAFSPSLSTAAIATAIANNKFAQTTVTVDPVEWANTPAAGLMVVAPDNLAGGKQAQLINAQ